LLAQVPRQIRRKLGILQEQGQQIIDQGSVCRCQAPLRGAESLSSATVDDGQDRVSSVESEKLKLLGLLAGTLAHDLNNPLCGVRSVLERFTRRSDLADGEQQLLQLALAQCERMKILLQDVQEFIYASPHEQSFFDLGPVVTTVLRLMHKQLKVSQIVVHPMIAPEPLMLMGCKDQIKQMLLQLLVATCRELASSQCEIAIKVLQEREWLRLKWEFTVAQGAAAERLVHLFAEFVQTDPVLDSGMGTAHSILEFHGGRMDLSTNAQGTALMVLSLPREQNGYERGWCGAGIRTDSR